MRRMLLKSKKNKNGLVDTAKLQPKLHLLALNILIEAGKSDSVSEETKMWAEYVRMTGKMKNLEMPVAKKVA